MRYSRNYPHINAVGILVDGDFLTVDFLDRNTRKQIKN